MSKEEKPISTTIKHFNELNFTVVAKAYSHYVEYAIYDIQGYEGLNDLTHPLWDKKGALQSSQWTTNLEEAGTYLHGSVKWDGCSNWLFDEQEKGYLHGCSREDVLRWGQILAECWDWTATLCPNWDYS